MAIVYSRVDSRLVHGQVGAKLVRHLNISNICIVDDEVAKDEFMKSIYQISSQACGAKVEIITVEQAVLKQQNNGFTSRYMLLFASIANAYKSFKAGLEIPELAIGSIKCDGPDMKLANKLVYISKEDAEKLREMAASGMNAYFQLMPDEGEPVSVETGCKNAGF